MKIDIYMEVIAPCGLIFSWKKAKNSACPAHVMWVIGPIEAVQNILSE